MKNFLPEEKLLRLIRGEKGKEPFRQPNPPDKFKSFFSIKILLILPFLLVSLYFLTSFLYPFITPKNLNLASFPEKNTDFELGKNIQPPNSEIPFQITSSRNVFKSLSSSTEGSSVPQAAADEMLRNFALKGIIFGDNPQAIIEDKKNQSTYYMAKGQFIGQYKVSDIQEGKVILELSGKKYELHI